MAQTQFSLMWDSHRKNISQGLCSLQQKGEFVDMTIAADGHFVKVHQVVVALASPYIKELLASIDCPHPVIILNKISYKTLCSILEYVYMGEAQVSLEDLNQFAQAAKELCIKGLEDMKLQDLLLGGHTTNEYQASESPVSEDNADGRVKFKVSVHSGEMEQTENFHIDSNDASYTNEEIIDETMDDERKFETVEEYNIIDETVGKGDEVTIENPIPDSNLMQYTVSNQGSLQMILNRYIYYMKYANRKNSRQWRCINYLTTSIKCPAQVVTMNGIVKLRIAAHTHPFHDDKILKKVHSGAVFTALTDAEQEGLSRMKSKNIKNK